MRTHSTFGFIIEVMHKFSCPTYPRDSSILPEDLASQSVRLKEEQLRREEEKVRTPLWLVLLLD